MPICPIMSGAIPPKKAQRSKDISVRFVHCVEDRCACWIPAREEMKTDGGDNCLYTEPPRCGLIQPGAK